MTAVMSAHPFVASALVGTFASLVGQLGLAAALDPLIGDDAANLVGLVADAGIDYYGQHEVLLGGPAPTKTQTERFVVSKAITIAFSQVLFMVLLPTVLRVAAPYKRKLSTGWALTQARGLINGITFLVLTYPLRRLWVFAPRRWSGIALESRPS